MTNRKTRVNPTLTRKHQKVNGDEVKAIRRRSPLLIAGIAGAVILVLLVVILITSPFKMLGADRVDTKNPVVSHQDGLTISYVSGNGLRVKLDTIPREAFLAGSEPKNFASAWESTPAYLEMKSPLYLIESRGEAEVMTDIVIPNAAEPNETLDLYTWDTEKERWLFVPASVDLTKGSITTERLVSNVAVFQTAPIVPMVSAFMDAGDVFDPAATGVVNLVIPSGVQVDASGAFSGSLVGGWQLGSGYGVTPVITASNGAGLLSTLSDQKALGDHVDAIGSFVTTAGYNGVAIDYRAIADANADTFDTFLWMLKERLDVDAKMLIVILPAPIQTAESWSTGAYHWDEIGNAADIVIIRGKEQPADYGLNGSAYQMLSWATDQISRARLHIFMPTNSYDATGNSPVGYFEAISMLGMAGVDGDGTTFSTGDEIAFNLNGDVDITPDQNTGAYILTGNNDGRQVYLVTASTVRARLDMVADQNVGGVSLLNIFANDRDPALYTAVTEFKNDLASSIPGYVSLVWTVTNADGAVIKDEVVGLATPFVWRASEGGQFNVNSKLDNAEGLDRGGLTIIVETKDTPTPVPTQAVVVTQQPGATQTQNAPPPVSSGGADGGTFALGGQIQRGYSPPAGVMQSAGMTWVKYQLKWSPGTSPSVAGDLINLAHGSGFKVLLSIPGQLYPTSIDFGGYTEFLRGVAAYQPDAIEIWNEMNLYVEWPEGQIDPGSYVSNMLAPGYNAIKSVSPNTMVIIGALAPTGVNNSRAMSDDQYVAGMAAAGAANYANCIGVHHNAGATSPSAREGHPAGTHYSWYFQPTLEVYYYGMGGALPVCITEFGYVTGEGLGTLPENFSWGSGNTLQEQAAWLGEGASIARNLGWVRLMMIWNVGFTTWGADPQAGFSITRPDGTCPACATLAAAVG